MPKILLAGQDIRLLETRAGVLRRTGAEVLYCIGADTREVIATETPELLVLCHTLLGEEAEAIADATRSSCPGTRILLVVSQIAEQRQPRETLFDATTLPEPARLIARAAELLGGTVCPTRDKQGGTGAEARGSNFEP